MTKTKTKIKRNPKKNPRITQMFLVLMGACSDAHRNALIAFNAGDIWLEDVDVLKPSAYWIADEYYWLYNKLFTNAGCNSVNKLCVEALHRRDALEAAQYAHFPGDSRNFYREYMQVRVAIMRDFIVEHYTSPQRDEFLSRVFIEVSTTGKISVPLRRVVLDEHGYAKDNCHRYFGVGEKVWEWENVDGFSDWVRAPDLRTARTLVARRVFSVLRDERAQDALAAFIKWV